MFGRDPLADIDRLFSSLLDSSVSRPGRGAFFSSAFGNWSTPTDIVETPTHYHVASDMPGVKKEDINIHFDDATEKVCIRGTRPYPGYLRMLLKKDSSEEDVVRRADDSTNSIELPSSGQTLLNERSFGTFERCFHFPSSVDKNKISAQFESGLLHVTLEKTATTPNGSGRTIVIQ